MTLTRDGSLLFFVLLALAAAGFVVALVRRSWPLWLAALTCTILAVGTAATHREAAPVAQSPGVTP